MTNPDLIARLSDLHAAASRLRHPRSDARPGAALDGIDELRAGIGQLLIDLRGPEPCRLAPRARVDAAAMPEGRIPGTRAVVQHRRRSRGATPAAQEAAAAHFPQSTREAPAGTGFPR